MLRFESVKLAQKNGGSSLLMVVAILAGVMNLCLADPMSEEKAVIGAGCFWCVEAVYENLPGVRSVLSGYAAGEKPNPTYEEVCSGRSGHAEVVEISFDPSIISYEEILSLFWDAHDPTTLNRQGADMGTQYRSIIIAQTAAQLEAASKSKAAAATKFADPIVTEIIEGAIFYPAENYHQDFAAAHPTHPYVRAVIAPKLQKLQDKK
jgi:peptide-methionine (S)-S-oxide reductase